VRHTRFRAKECRDEGSLQREKVGFGYSELKVENIEKLAFDPADIPGTEYACGECPLRILQRSVIMVLYTPTDPMLRQHSNGTKLVTMKHQPW